ncbi:hypothetical protein V8B55DRAFT_1409162 [Mucor lusitanicus]|uniref:XPG-I domain-containing protein n=1 Tax=Mucor lusitanicus CBS 277.49 TaxID=747725 RepID=A0A168P8A8_MUCCL|nr:hypothetical protein MUCCIDRAFT_104242 [Mucor lusitanicus CBS 277.49]
MGVRGAWKLLQEQGIIGSTVGRPVDALGWRDTQKKIHVDMVGAFYDQLCSFFVHCDRDDQEAKIKAANKLMVYIGKVVPKHRLVLYLDGSKPSLERDFAHTKRLTFQLDRQERLEQELSMLKPGSYSDRISQWEHAARDLFRFTDDMKEVVYQAAMSKGWTIIVSPSEAEVEIGKLPGGIVFSNDSDMLFYPNVSKVIRRMDRHQFCVYDKSAILTRLQLSNNAFTALGIIAPNDYESHIYGTHSAILSIYRVVERIQRGQNLSVNDILQEYLSECSARLGRDLPADYYAKSYRVFVLQEEHLLPPSYDIRSGYLNTAAHYLKKISNIQGYTR